MFCQRHLINTFCSEWESNQCDIMKLYVKWCVFFMPHFSYFCVLLLYKCKDASYCSVFFDNGAADMRYFQLKGANTFTVNRKKSLFKHTSTHTAVSPMCQMSYIADWFNVYLDKDETNRIPELHHFFMSRLLQVPSCTSVDLSSFKSLE